MNKKEVLKIITTIEEFYNRPWTGRGFDQLKKTGFMDENETPQSHLLNVVNLWHDILKDYDFDNIKVKLTEHIKTSKFTPTIADLIHVEKRDRAIPTIEETKVMLAKQDEWRANKASEEVRQKALADMRKILGIERG
jgi:hypothetical protein